MIFNLFCLPSGVGQRYRVSTHITCPAQWWQEPGGGSLYHGAGEGCGFFVEVSIG